LALASEIGLPVVVSSALETSVGIAMGVALAAALPELPFACGLATVQLLTKDVAERPLLPVDGFLPVGEVKVREDFGGALADDESSTAWQARLMACEEFL
jgi:O-succinylbenzoate synthase